MPPSFARKAVGLFGALSLLTAALGGCGSGDLKESGTAVTQRNCPTGPAYSDRWAGEMAGGPVDGPVVIAIGREALDDGLGLTWDPDREVLFAKVLIGISAPAGTPVRLRGRMLGSGAPLRFTHLRQNGESVAELPDRGRSPLVDLPGYVETTEPGCAEVRVRVGPEPAGPFFLRLRPPA